MTQKNILCPLPKHCYVCPPWHGSVLPPGSHPVIRFMVSEPVCYRNKRVYNLWHNLFQVNAEFSALFSLLSPRIWFNQIASETSKDVGRRWPLQMHGDMVFDIGGKSKPGQVAQKAKTIRLEQYGSDAPKEGASEPAQSLSRLTLDRATVIPLDQASILLSGPCQSPSRSPRGLWVMAFDWFPGCICCLCLNLAGEMRPRISKGVIQATLSHGGHDRNPLGRKNQMLGRKEANIFSQWDSILLCCCCC